MAQPASTKFYDPKDPNSRVALEARCDIMYTVLSNESGTWSKVVEILEPLCDKLPFYTDLLAFDGLASSIGNLTYYLDLRDLYVNENESAAELNRIMEECGDLFRAKIYPAEDIEQLEQIVESMLGLTKTVASYGLENNEAIFLICRAYRETCLKNMGNLSYSLLLRFLSFCNRHRLNPMDYFYIYEMLNWGDLNKLESQSAPLSYRFALLDLREWHKKLAHFPETKNLSINNTLGWFLTTNKVSISRNFMPLGEEPTGETDLRVEKAQRETWQDYKKRRDKDSKQRGLKSYSGQRATAAAGDHDYWIYLYKVRGLSSDEIHKQEYPSYNLDRDPDIPGIERAISRRLKLAHIKFYPFGEKRKLDKELAEFRLET